MVSSAGTVGIGRSAGNPVAGVGPAVLMAAALGWVGGTYHWPGKEWSAQLLFTAVHLVPVTLVLLAVSMIISGRRERAGRVVLTVLAAAIKAMTVFVTVWVIVRPGGFGPHGFLDWFPIAMANAGGGLWIRSVFFPRREPMAVQS